MWLILIVDMLFWGLVMPPIAVVMWLPLRLIARTCPPSPEFFLKVETPWDILLHAWIQYGRVAKGIIVNGFIIMNNV